MVSDSDCTKFNAFASNFRWKSSNALRVSYFFQEISGNFVATIFRKIARGRAFTLVLYLSQWNFFGKKMSGKKCPAIFYRTSFCRLDRLNCKSQKRLRKRLTRTCDKTMRP